MPKKKLTKAQVKRKILRMGGLLYDLLTDKLGHPDSFVPWSTKKMFELNTIIASASKRMK